MTQIFSQNKINIYRQYTIILEKSLDYKILLSFYKIQTTYKNKRVLPNNYHYIEFKF